MRLKLLISKDDFDVFFRDHLIFQGIQLVKSWFRVDLNSKLWNLFKTFFFKTSVLCLSDELLAVAFVRLLRKHSFDFSNRVKHWYKSKFNDLLNVRPFLLCIQKLFKNVWTFSFESKFRSFYSFHFQIKSMLVGLYFIKFGLLTLTNFLVMIWTIGGDNIAYLQNFFASVSLFLYYLL